MKRVLKLTTKMRTMKLQTCLRETCFVETCLLLTCFGADVKTALLKAAIFSLYSRFYSILPYGQVARFDWWQTLPQVNGNV